MTGILKNRLTAIEKVAKQKKNGNLQRFLELCWNLLLVYAYENGFFERTFKRRTETPTNILALLNFKISLILLYSLFFSAFR